MDGKLVGGLMLLLVGIGTAGLTNAMPPLTAISANEKKPDGIYVDVIVEEVDFAASTISARGTIYVVPPHDNVGGQIATTGTTDSHKDKVTRYVRLPVMPEANLKGKNAKAGSHAVLRLKMLRDGLLVVDGIEEFTGVERIGVEWLAAPRTK